MIALFLIITSRSLPQHMHGYLSRFLSEADTGVYVGNVSKRVRDNLWRRCSEALKEGSLTMINEDSRREQGFAINTLGPNRRTLIDMDGLLLSATFSTSKAKNRRSEA